MEQGDAVAMGGGGDDGLGLSPAEKGRFTKRVRSDGDVLSTVTGRDNEVARERRPTRFTVRPHYFLPGDIVWVRPAGLPYWPAEVVQAELATNSVTARLFDPPASLLPPADEDALRGHVTVSSTKVFFFDRLQTPEEVEVCVEQRLQRRTHNVSAYEADFQRAVLHANRLVRIVLSPEKLQPYSICGVGVVHSLMRTHISAPRQPHTTNFAPQTAVIKLRVGLENALRDLRGFEFIWVLFSFSYSTLAEEQEGENGPSTVETLPEGTSRRRRRQGAERSAGFKTMLVPPRDTELRGVFATRSPHRPNFIGLSCVRLVAVRGLEIHIADHDLLHGTPVLDIKPYLPFCDAHPDAKAGWVEELDTSGGGGADHKYNMQRRQVDRIFEGE
ncbi:SAM-binding protein [Trypanosoma rangeli]|uniref:SAM-binding protein n=1 Tax=Trypanosoma rangeli TaxID=5698 RepID=A0A3R7K8Q3_TRYRA|nr:SAM-binding protein [Trypanosoma rangeli]RNF03544.1 SAM-binding protein [Trypanosoma rangeli]|eukprot:RNF03544.1 SAM-binding protein [Trypanosoma rangeli]